MAAAAPGDLTEMLNALGRGDRGAAEVVLPAVYEDLRFIARAHLGREASGHTLEPTALVHEAYLRLVDQNRVSWNGKAHFLAVAARVMRRLLIDHARRRRAEKWGGGAEHVTLVDAHAVTEDDPIDVLALDAALTKLASVKERQALTVELRYFGGLEIREVADVLGVSHMTVKRDWSYARAWLSRELGDRSTSDPS